MSKVQNKVTVVTGASKGIGAEIALEMAKEGAKVVINYLSDQNAAETLCAKIIKSGGTALTIQADVTKSEEVQRLFAETHRKFGKIDTLINNAGVYKFEPLELITEEEFRRQFDSNVLGTLLSIQEALKYFNDNGGSIVNISSVASIKATPMTVLYSATKSAVDSITRTLSKELSGKKIRVNSILPGPTETEGNPVLGTEMEQYIVANTPLGRVGAPKDISKLSVFLASDDASWITGQKISVSGGFD
jgi:3-oxoacyl-[acyl-carrier protein] reductase